MVIPRTKINVVTARALPLQHGHDPLLEYESPVPSRLPFLRCIANKPEWCSDAHRYPDLRQAVERVFQADTLSWPMSSSRALSLCGRLGVPPAGIGIVARPGEVVGKLGGYFLFGNGMDLVDGIASDAAIAAIAIRDRTTRLNVAGSNSSRSAWPRPHQRMSLADPQPNRCLRAGILRVEQRLKTWLSECGRSPVRRRR